jgi:peptide alpha-N-acetyltransferase
LYQASLVYKELLERNPENFFYFKRLEETRRPATVEERLKICTEVADQNRFASVARRLPLSFLTGKHFELALDSYMRRMLMKGTAPLFKLLKNLYSDKEKVHIIEQKALGYLESLRSCRKFHPEDAEWDVQSPTCELWTLHVLAQHFCHLGHFERALQCIGEALEHTPTLIELYIVQGKLYKCAGDITKAAECLNEGRMLDTADRYINCKCAKYMLQSDQVERAEELCSMFTRVCNTDIGKEKRLIFELCRRVHLLQTP